MDKIVIIVFLFVTLVAWISWLIYNYKLAISNIKVNETIRYYSDKYTNLQHCVTDFVNAVRYKFPKSTIKYTNDEETESIEGEIKY